MSTLPSAGGAVEHGNTPTAGCVLDLEMRTVLAGSGLTVTSVETFDEKAAPKVAGLCDEGRSTA